MLHRRLACSIALSSLFACSLPPAYSIRIVDSHGEPLPSSTRNGQRVVLGRPGQDYGIELTNRTGQFVGVVISVDGLDTNSGRAADFTPEGIDRRGSLRLPPRSYWAHLGFAVSDTSISTFRFVSAAESFGARLHRAQKLGTIEVGFFSLSSATHDVPVEAYAVDELAPVAAGDQRERAAEPVYGDLRPSAIAMDRTFVTTAASRPLAHFLIVYDGPGGTKLGTAGPAPRPASPAPSSSSSPVPPIPGEITRTSPEGAIPPKATQPSNVTKPHDAASPPPKAPKPGKGVGKNDP